MKKCLSVTRKISIHSKQNTPRLSPQPNYFDSFAFVDRFTNNRFKYRQANRNSNDRSSDDSHHNEKHQTKKLNSKQVGLNSSINIFKYTKKFEIECIREKYFKGSTEVVKEEIADVSSLGKAKLQRLKQDKEQVYRLNKIQLRRILTDQSLRVSPQILRLNNLMTEYSSDSHHPLKKHTRVQRRTHEPSIQEQQEQGKISPNQWRITQKFMNHMKNQIKSNGEYLLNLPQQQKKKNLFIKNRNFKIAIMPNKSYSKIAKSLIISSD